MTDVSPVQASGLGRLPPAVLLVTDRERQRVAIRSILAALDVVFVEADSGTAALTAALRQTFALILMDAQMPGMDGYETAKLIRQRRETGRTPIIFITAGAPGDTATSAAYDSGAVDFVFTPIVPGDLRAKVSVFVDLFLQSEELLLQSEELHRSLESIAALNAALHDSQASTQAVLDNVADGIVIADAEGLIESINPSARALFGYPGQEAIGRPLTLMIAPTLRDDFRDLANTPPNAATETLGCRRDASTFAMEVEYGEISHGDRTLMLVFVRDISNRNAHTEVLERRALHDGLTGLANRTLFGEHVLHALGSAKRNSELRAVLMMGLDGFKRINDTFGHEQGDLLLKQVSHRLVATLRESDTIARLGGDEFAILPAGPTDLPAAAQVAWKVQQACKPGFVVTDEIVHVAASVGIAVFPEQGTTTAELLRHADAAMYVAKRRKTGHAVFDPVHETQGEHQLKLLADLRQCVAREELVLHYQPRIDLSTREISGVEALLRWQHPANGLLAPASFMPQVERTALITPVTRWVLDEALRQQRLWLDQGLDLTMAVNISGHSLRHSNGLLDTIAELTNVWDTAPERLILELTEGALIETAAPDILGRLHDMGEIMSIDDFGTGYSSLAHLQRLPVDEIKIDRSFVTSLAASTHDAAIVRSTIYLAHNLGLTVVAEGVEDKAAMDLLAGYGCDSVQGYHLSRPCAAEELTTWLTDSPYAAPAHGN
jgi:diguanylate cyclase (GGDEF)-like protein/PAS domain S-box-containing protein